MQSSSTQRSPALTIASTPVYFEEDWAAGIGGGLWSTGLAIGLYLSQFPDHAKRFMERKSRVSFLELGSGNGFLSVCFLALAKELDCSLVITDTKEHLPLINLTLEGNDHIIKPRDSQKNNPSVKVLEHQWGTFPPSDDQENPLNQSFDLIFGSDLAYRDELHDPLISSLRHFSDAQTVIILGITMLDTKPIFFSKLREAGFAYERLADHLMDPKFRGTTFGIFVIQKTASIPCSTES